MGTAMGAGSCSSCSAAKRLKWASEPRYYVGVDLRLSTAIAVARRVEPPWPVPEDDFGLKPKLTYARGSVEWDAEQRRLKNNAQNKTHLKIIAKSRRAD